MENTCGTCGQQIPLQIDTLISKISLFDLSCVCEHPKINIIGKKGTGKSFIIRSLLKYYSDRRVVIFSPCDRVQKFYSANVDPQCIYYEYNSDIVKELLDQQLRLKNLSKLCTNLKKKINPDLVVVMDDCLSLDKWKNDHQIRELLMNAHYYNITLIMSTQYPPGIPPDLRNNFDYVFLLSEDWPSNQKRLYDQYTGMFPTFKAFQQVFTHITKDFRSMVISYRGITGSFLDKVHHYKATEEADFKIKHVDISRYIF